MIVLALIARATRVALFLALTALVSWQAQSASARDDASLARPDSAALHVLHASLATDARAVVLTDALDDAQPQSSSNEAETAPKLPAAHGMCTAKRVDALRLAHWARCSFFVRAACAPAATQRGRDKVDLRSVARKLFVRAQPLRTAPEDDDSAR